MRLSVAYSCAAAIVGLLAANCAIADDKDVVEYREHLMTTLNEQAGAVGQIVSGAVPGENLSAHLDAIALTASLALKAFQPKVPGGEAKPEVWTNWPDFSKRMNEFVEKTTAVAKAAKASHKDIDDVSGIVMDALNCKACHDTYRQERVK